MTANEILKARDQKRMMYYKAKGRCAYCGKMLALQQAQCAHRIHKGYVKMFGAEIIHHPLNMRITCADCNHKALLNPATHPIEAAKLISEIRRQLNE